MKIYSSEMYGHYNNLLYNKNINISLATFLAGGWENAGYVIHSIYLNHALSDNSSLRREGAFALFSLS